MTQQVTVPRSFGGTLILQLDITPPATSVLPVAICRVTFRDGKTAVTFRDGVVKTGGR